jgi:DNA-binding MarR family transcriptional regulator
MHAVFFGVKRIHHEVVHRVTRPLLEATDCELTPARFDLMRIVSLRPHGVHQGTLLWLLGVSPPTVSRMLKSLEELGMITRERLASDGRCRKVHITAKGVGAVKMALDATVGSGEAEGAVACCATGKPRPRDAKRNGRRQRPGGTRTRDDAAPNADAAKAQVDALDGALVRMRKGLRDVAPFHHPWRATDYAPYAFHTIVDGVVRYGGQSPLDADWNPELWTNPLAPYFSPS